MNNVLFCIGCNKYDYLAPLNGAEKDAMEIYTELRSGGLYDTTRSVLLRSPSLSQYNLALRKLFAGGPIDVFTFFFAGHGGVTSGNFYLCMSDSEVGQLSLSAVSMASFFVAVNEFKPWQVNIVVDACESGGSAYDLGNLLKQDVIGGVVTTSVSFLGACTAKQYAEENDQGGILTQTLLTYLQGVNEIQTVNRFLDLIELGNAVSRKVQGSGVEQVPTCWGLTLYGQGRFAKNRLFLNHGDERTFQVSNIGPNTDVGVEIQHFSPELWSEFRLIKTNFDARRLLNLLKRVIGKFNADPTKIIAVLDGLLRSFSTRVLDSSDLFAESNLLATVAVSLLPYSDDEAVSQYVKTILERRRLVDAKIYSALSKAVCDNSNVLVQSVGVVANLYYLPIRIFRILAWFAASVVVSHLFNRLDDYVDGWILVESVIEKYHGSIVAVNDEQAVQLYLFFKACQIAKRLDLAEDVVNSIFGSFVERRCKVARVSLDSEHAFSYLLSIAAPDDTNLHLYKANPSHLLSVLLTVGHELKFDSVWQLRDLDKECAGCYLSDNYAEFSEDVMENGINYVQQLGRGIWTLSGYSTLLKRQLQQNFALHKRFFKPAPSALCTLASLLMPDRIPYFLEEVLSDLAVSN